MHGIGNFLGDVNFLAQGFGGFDNFWEKLDFHLLDEVVVEPSGFFVSFDAERLENSFRIDGTLSIIRTWPNQDDFTVDEFTARSGSRRLLPIPNGDDWQLGNLNYRDERGNRYNNRMIRDGVGFSIDITPDPRYGRSLLRVHPDGGAAGTQGCIGLTCNGDRLTVFEETMESLLDVHGTLRLEVSGSYNGPDGGWNDNPINLTTPIRN